MIEDVTPPLYYVVTRKLPAEDASAVMGYLRITPVVCAVISNVLDGVLARELCSEVIFADDDAKARQVAGQIAIDMQRPCLVVGEASFMDAVYQDNRVEAVAKQA